jgi:putative drug exporter of the RND superfamily
MRIWTEWVLRYRIAVLFLWVVLAGLGGALASRTVDALSYDFALPGQPAYEANQDIVARFGSGGVNDPLILTVTLPAGTSATDPRTQLQLAATFDRITAAVPGARVASYPSTKDPAFLADSGRTTFALVYPPPTPGPEPYVAALPVLQAAAADATVAGAPVRLTGADVLETASGASADRGVLIEVILGGAGALVVLILVFSSLLAAVPLLIAGVSILTTFLCVLGLTAVSDVSFVVQYLVALIGLGVAIDYALLIVMRWREERARGAENAAAVHKAMQTAGRSVIFSGITVAVSLAALVAVPVPFLRSIGYGGLLIPLLSVAAAVTLLPAILSLAGPRLEWPRRSPRNPGSRRWAAVAGAMARWPVPAVVVATGLLLALAAPVLTLQLGSPEIGAYSTADPAGQAGRHLTDAGVAPGAFRPVEVVTSNPDEVVARLRQVPGVAAALAPAGPGWTAGDSALVQVWTADDPAGSAGNSTIERVRDAAASFPATQVGGSAAEDIDFVDAVYGSTPAVVAVIVLVTVVLLMRALRSMVLPIKALVLNVLSIGAAYGITVLIWQHGWLTDALFGREPSGAITTWLPIAVFAFLFGLSMDYELFILSRMREEYDRTGSTAGAIVDGFSYTGRLVTSAALILFLAFVALSTVPATEVKILATALAFGIAIDALVVRTVLTPAVVALLGRVSWWMPAWAARTLRLAPAPVREPLGTAPAATAAPRVPVTAPQRVPATAPQWVPATAPQWVPATAPDGRGQDRTGENGRVLGGQVYGLDRLPARAVLTLTDLGGRQIARARTEPGGGYRLQLPARGTYLLVCTPDAATGSAPVAERITILDSPITHDIRLPS